MMFHRLAACEQPRCFAPLSALASAAAQNPRLRIQQHSNSNNRRNRRILLRPSRREGGTSQAGATGTTGAGTSAAAQEPIRVTRPGQPPENVIEAIEFRGARRVRQDTLQA
jgi:hypothetical protein